jgi:hypothetical protein
MLAPEVTAVGDVHRPKVVLGPTEEVKASEIIELEGELRVRSPQRFRNAVKEAVPE